MLLYLKNSRENLLTKNNQTKPYRSISRDQLSRKQNVT